MTARIFNRVSISAAALVLIGLAVVPCAAQDSSSASAQKIILVPGQGHAMVLTQFTAPPATYALTGEQNPSAQSAITWQKQAGPVYRFGNGSVMP